MNRKLFKDTFTGLFVESNKNKVAKMGSITIPRNSVLPITEEMYNVIDIIKATTTRA
jgi:hypothetical protein